MGSSCGHVHALSTSVQLCCLPKAARAECVGLLKDCIKVVICTAVPCAGRSGSGLNTLVVRDCGADEGVVEGLDLGVSRMKLNEKAELTLSPAYAFKDQARLASCHLLAHCRSLPTSAGRHPCMEQPETSHCFLMRPATGHGLPFAVWILMHELAAFHVLIHSIEACSIAYSHRASVVRYCLIKAGVD